MKNNKLQKLRKEIDEIDWKIFLLFEKRFKAVSKIGEFKKEENRIIKDKKREDEIVKSKIKKIKIDEVFAKKIYKIIFNHSYKIQKENALKKNSKN